MDFFKPIWMQEYKNLHQYHQATAALLKMTDQKKLEKAARFSPVSDLRMIAVKKITQEQTLYDIARDDPDAKVRLTACGQITEQPLLLQLLSETRDDLLKLSLYKRLEMHHEYNCLAAMTLGFMNGGREALQNLNDPFRLAEVALQHRDCWMRCQAIERITDRKALYRLATGNYPAAAFGKKEDLTTRQTAASQLIGSDELLAAWKATSDRSTRQEIFGDMMHEIPLAYATDYIPCRELNSSLWDADFKREMESVQCDTDLLLHYLLDHSDPAIRPGIIRKLITFNLPEAFRRHADIFWLLDWMPEDYLSALQNLPARDQKTVFAAITRVILARLDEYAAKPDEDFFSRLHYARQLCEDASRINYLPVFHQYLENDPPLLKLIAMRSCLYNMAELALEYIKDPVLVRKIGETVFIPKTCEGLYYTGNSRSVYIGGGPRWRKLAEEKLTKILAALGEEYHPENKVCVSAETQTEKPDFRDEIFTNMDEGFYGWKAATEKKKKQQP